LGHALDVELVVPVLLEQGQGRLEDGVGAVGLAGTPAAAGRRQVVGRAGRRGGGHESGPGRRVEGTGAVADLTPTPDPELLTSGYRQPIVNATLSEIVVSHDNRTEVHRGACRTDRLQRPPAQRQPGRHVPG